jgi:proteasome lid subunit RPN8/RPN11
MTLALSIGLLEQIHAHGQTHYPEEGAGLILGTRDGDLRVGVALIPLANNFESESRQRRYLLSARDMLEAEDKADQMGLEILGVFHSHPDHPARPSDFDRTWALPHFSYLITSVMASQAVESTAWRLTDNRQAMIEEELKIIPIGG